MDMAAYVPLPLLRKWVDMARDQDQFLFLFGHRVLPDAEFATGVVVSVSERELIAEAPVAFKCSEDTVIVPDISRRSMAAEPFHVVKCEGKVISVDHTDLRQATAAGATFLIGPTYGMRLSDFRALIEYAAPRVKFCRVRDVVKSRQPASKPP